MHPSVDKLDKTEEIFAISDLITELSRLATKAADLHCASAVVLIASASQVLDLERSQRLDRLASLETEAARPH
jgi:hypothetical protein